MSIHPSTPPSQGRRRASLEGLRLEGTDGWSLQMSSDSGVREQIGSSPGHDSQLDQGTAFTDDEQPQMHLGDFSGLDDYDVRHHFWSATSRARTIADSSFTFDPPTQHTPMQPTSPMPVESRYFMPSQQPDAGSNWSRPDLAARNALREMIISALLTETLIPPERVALLDDCRASAEESNLGVPFREILSEPMEPLGVSALMYEIMRCQPDWDLIDKGEDSVELEMVDYLIQYWTDNVLAHGRMGVLMNVVRTACLRRLDEYEGNKLFQHLRLKVFLSHVQNGEHDKFFDYDISLTPHGQSRRDGTGSLASNLGFSTLISIPQFTMHLVQPMDVSVIDPIPGMSRKPSYSAMPKFVAVEFLAARRAWRLKVGNNSLELELLDGPSGSSPYLLREESVLMTDVRVTIVMPEREHPENVFGKDLYSTTGIASSSTVESGSPIELLLPRTLLRPISASGPGSTEITLSPCFCAGPGDFNPLRGLDDPRLLHDGRDALLLDLTVRFAQDQRVSSFVQRSTAPSRCNSSLAFDGYSPGSPSHSNEGFEDDLYVSPSFTDKMNDLSLEARAEESEWEEVSQVDETEARNGGWVKASWNGKDEEL